MVTVPVYTAYFYAVASCCREVYMVLEKNCAAYRDFVDQVLSGLGDFYGEEADVSVKKVRKNNGISLDALTIMGKGDVMTPAFYMEDIFKACSGDERPVQRAVRDIVDLYERNRGERDFDPGLIREYKRASRILGFKLVNAEKNSALLEEVPHRRILDLALVYICIMGNTGFGNASVMVKNDLISLWKKTETDLFEQALINMPRLLPPEIKSLGKVLKDCSFPLDDAEPMNAFIVTNSTGLFGAAAICCDGVLDNVSDILGGRFYILPSSIHEVIAVPAGEGHDPGDLLSMVKDVNRRVVERGEVLSDSVYIYSRGEKSLTFACSGDEKTC